MWVTFLDLQIHPKKDPVSRLTSNCSSNCRITSKSPAVRSLESMDEESDVPIPTPKTRARFLPEGILEGQKIVSPFQKPNDIYESRHPSERNQQVYERRAAEPETTKEYIKMDHMRESLATEENEEVRRTKEDPRSSRVRQSHMAVPKQVTEEFILFRIFPFYLQNPTRKKTAFFSSPPFVFRSCEEFYILACITGFWVKVELNFFNNIAEVTLLRANIRVAVCEISSR